MLSDPEKHIRELAARRILKARLANHSGKVLRVFVVPKINVNAKSYTELIDWKQKYFQPPILRDVTMKICSRWWKQKVVKIYLF